MLQRPCAMLAFLLVGAVFVVIPASASAQAQPPAQSLDGLWLTDGYGELIEFQGDELHWFEITQVSCVPAGHAVRKSGAGRGHDSERVVRSVLVRGVAGRRAHQRPRYSDRQARS